MPTIAVFEPGHSGHLFAFVRLLIEECARRGWEALLITTRSAVDSEEYGMHLGDIQAQFSVAFVPVEWKARDVHRVAKANSVTRIVVPHGDVAIFPLAVANLMSNRIPITALIMRDPRWNSGSLSLSRCKGFIKLAALRLVDCMVWCNIVWLRESTFAGPARYRYVRDPFIASGTMSQIRAMAHTRSLTIRAGDDRYWLLVTGAISGRKNLRMILSALAIAGRSGREYGLWIFGPIKADAGISEDGVKRFAEEHGLHTIVENRHISNFEMNVAVAAVDAIVMAYSSHSPNSTMGKAAHLGTRAIVAGPPSVQRFARSIPGSLVCDLNLESLASIIEMAPSRAPLQLVEPLVDESSFAEALLDD